MPPVINPNLCTGCGTCAEICPVQVFRYDRDKEKIPEVKFRRECWHCNACVLDCPSKAIQLHVPLPYMLVHVNSADLKPRG